MNMRRQAAVGLVISLGASAAFACSDAGFTPETSCPIRPDEGTRVPANIPALAFGVFTTSTPANFELRGPDGGIVPVTVEHETAPPYGYLARLSEPLEVDAGYVASVSCAYIDGGVRSVRFETSPAVALPASVGTLTALTPQANPRVGPPCYGPNDGVQAELELMPSAELEAFMPVTRFTVTASTLTAPWATAWYAHGFHAADPQFANRLDRVYTVCNGGSGGLPHGTTTVTLQAMLAGSSTAWTFATTTVTLTCDGGVGDAGMSEQPDAGIDPTDAGMDPMGHRDAGTSPMDQPDAGTSGPTDAGTDDPSPRATGCGCSSGGEAAAIFALMLLALLRSRTRRDRASRSPVVCG